jgi:hypothetical protein
LAVDGGSAGENNGSFLTVGPSVWREIRKKKKKEIKKKEKKDWASHCELG